jgi:hypothetical protein
MHKDFYKRFLRDVLTIGRIATDKAGGSVYGMFVFVI